MTNSRAGSCCAPTGWTLVRRDPHLPAGRLPRDWPGAGAETVFRRLAGPGAPGRPAARHPGAGLIRARTVRPERGTA
ncbi:PaaX family transcriptional regulator C-terminal domain-containing protein [Streptomyces sp. NPDC004237]|uniref:PaaX family transcriptional regulator C-terminal domain-containing protein n=1 Tax=Streptomyces sp. NPDC004237 TaxID=3154455 RepID=UPI0033B4A1BE